MSRPHCPKIVPAQLLSRELPATWRFKSGGVAGSGWHPGLVALCREFAFSRTAKHWLATACGGADRRRPLPQLHEFVRSTLPASSTASGEVIDQPTTCGTWWRVGAVYRAHRHQRLQVVWQFDSNSAEFAAGDVFFNHKMRHVSEAEPGAQKSVPRTHVGEPPGVLREHAVVLAFGQRRSIGQHELHMPLQFGLRDDALV